MGNLQNRKLIYSKGFLFLLCGILSAGLLLAESPTWYTACLLSLTVWSFCRFYYFAFYVIEHYVDRNYRFSGLWDFAKYCMHRKRK
jgi:hypothetical protein